MRVFVYPTITVASQSVWTSAPRQTRLILSVFVRSARREPQNKSECLKFIFWEQEKWLLPTPQLLNDAFAPETMTFSDNSHFWANFLCRSPNKTMDACSAQKNGCLLFVFRNSFSLFGDLYSGVCRLILYSALGFGWPVDVQDLLTVAVLRC